MLKILNLYAGIGGNRKLWTDVEVVAVEINPKIAKIYQDFFPNDKVIVADAIEYFEKHFHEFDFIWASPPCQTHSRINRFNVARRYNGENTIKIKIPDFLLHSLINFLYTYYRGKFVVENTYSDYKPVFTPQQLGRHFIWSNFDIGDYKTKSFHNIEKHFTIKELCELHKLPFDYLGKLKIEGIDIKQILRNCIEPELGLHILNESKRNIQPDLFK